MASDSLPSVSEDTTGAPEVTGPITAPFLRMLALLYTILGPLWAFGIYEILSGRLPRELAISVVSGTALLLAAGVWLLVAGTTAVSVTVGEDGVVAVLRTARPSRRRRVFVRWTDFSQKVIFSPYYGSVALDTTGPSKLILGLTVAQAKAVLHHPRCTIRNLPPALVRRLFAE